MNFEAQIRISDITMLDYLTIIKWPVYDLMDGSYLMDEPKHDGNFGLKMARSVLGYYPLFSLGKINSFCIIVETCITRRRKKREKTIARTALS